MLAFMRKLFASKSVMYFLIRSQDETYVRLMADNQQLLNLNQELTQTAERQHRKLQEFAANLVLTEAAYKEKIVALEKQIDLYASHKSRMRRWYDKIRTHFMQGSP
jgi:bifunctional ADP-heptose synthase (sugar kinase/adenylyltransferase)